MPLRIPRVVLRLAPGPTWKSGLPEEQPGWEAHAEFIDDLIERGVFIMGGPYAGQARLDVAVGRHERRRGAGSDAGRPVRPERRLRDRGRRRLDRLRRHADRVTMRAVATIGVYGWTLDRFLAALDEADVRLLLDVRQRRGVRGAEYAWANAQRLGGRACRRRGRLPPHPRSSRPRARSDSSSVSRRREARGSRKRARVELPTRVRRAVHVAGARPRRPQVDPRRAAGGRHPGASSASSGIPRPAIAG